MIAELVARRRMDAFLRAFERKDFETMARRWADDVVVTFPPGLPMSGEWRGRQEVRALFEAVFAHNARMRLTLHDVAVLHPWSPRGRSTVIALWDAEEEGVDGDLVRTGVVSVAETRWWRGVRSEDYFSDVPAMARHYARMPLPPRRAAAAATA